MLRWGWRDRLPRICLLFFFCVAAIIAVVKHSTFPGCVCRFEYVAFKAVRHPVMGMESVVVPYLSIDVNPLLRVPKTRSLKRKGVAVEYNSGRIYFIRTTKLRRSQFGLRTGERNPAMETYCGSFPEILENNLKRHGRLLGVFYPTAFYRKRLGVTTGLSTDLHYPDPCTLINSEVFAQLVPLSGTDGGVQDTSDDAAKREKGYSLLDFHVEGRNSRFPLLQPSALLFAGLVLFYKSWWKIENRTNCWLYSVARVLTFILLFCSAAWLWLRLQP